jgi:hypothetical protein
VAGLLRALGDAPAGTRQEVAREYLADHPGSAEELRDVRATVRQQVRTCRSGG